MRVSVLDNDDPKVWSSEKMDGWRTKLCNAIKERDVVDVELLLDSPPGELCDILNTPLIRNDSKPISRHNGRAESFGSNCTRFSLPIILAAVHGDLEIVDLLCDDGASIYSKDVEGDNVIHALIWIAAFKPEKEKDLCVMFEKLMTLASTDENKKRLLIVEDIDGLRPFELASKLGTFLLFGRIVETEGVYKVVVAVSPIARKVRYDISEYESSGPNGRAMLSPLNFLRYMRDDEIEKEGAVEIFKHPAMAKWIDSKLRACYRLAPFPVSNLILCIVALIVSDEFGHSDICPVNKNVTSFGIQSEAKWTIFYSAVIVDFINTVCISWYFIRSIWIVHKEHPSGAMRFFRPRVMTKGRPLLVNSGIFYTCQCMKTLLFVMYAIVTATVTDWGVGKLGEAMLMIRVNIEIAFWWLILYYIQIFPGIGHTITGALRCIRIFLGFLVVFAMFYVAASLGLRSMARYFCLPELGYSSDSMYSTLMIMLNMINMRDLVGGHAKLPVPLMMIHILIVSILAILLLNYLIALISDAVGKVESHRVIIQCVTSFNVALDFMQVQVAVRGLLPKCIQWKQTPFVIDVEEYTV
jgi:hypothetical protein